jgi:hypothetical protein
MYIHHKDIFVGGRTIDGVFYQITQENVGGKSHELLEVTYHSIHDSVSKTVNLSHDGTIHPVP